MHGVQMSVMRATKLRINPRKFKIRRERMKGQDSSNWVQSKTADSRGRSVSLTPASNRGECSAKMHPLGTVTLSITVVVEKFWYAGSWLAMPYVPVTRTANTVANTAITFRSMCTKICRYVEREDHSHQ